jgi:hypothetical protein
LVTGYLKLGAILSKADPQTVFSLTWPLDAFLKDKPAYGSFVLNFNLPLFH